MLKGSMIRNLVLHGQQIHLRRSQKLCSLTGLHAGYTTLRSHRHLHKRRVANGFQRCQSGLPSSRHCQSFREAAFQDHRSQNYFREDIPITVAANGEVCALPWNEGHTQEVL